MNIIKRIALVAVMLLVLVLAVSCGHQHNLKKVDKINPTCTDSGSEAAYMCEDCGKLFEDVNGEIEIDSPKSIAATGHKITGCFTYIRLVDVNTVLKLLCTLKCKAEVENLVFCKIFSPLYKALLTNLLKRWSNSHEIKARGYTALFNLLDYMLLVKAKLADVNTV